jgi:adenylate cyclase
LFSDPRGFTAIAELRQPEETASILSCYFERMIDAVFRHGGIVDKLTGDGIMALFGTPLDMPKQEEAAILCALDMKRSLNKLREVIGMHELNISVGINTGSVVVGNIGSGKTMDYTVVGDAVNVAARLERKTREHKVDILISHVTAEPVRGRFNLRMIGPITLHGRAEPVIVYSVDDKEVKSG